MFIVVNMVIIIDFVDGMVINMDFFEFNIILFLVVVCLLNEIIMVVLFNYFDYFGLYRLKYKVMNLYDFENFYKKVKNKVFKDD